MSDADFVDVGDELVVSIAGYPVTNAKIVEVGEKVKIALTDGIKTVFLFLPLDFKEHEVLDGYGHHSQPLTGVENGHWTV